MLNEVAAIVTVAADIFRKHQVSVGGTTSNLDVGTRCSETDGGVVLDVAGCSVWLGTSLRPPNEGTQGDLQITELQDG